MSTLTSQGGASAGEARWFAVPRPRPAARLRLYCLPYSGASAALYAPWAGLLPEEVELCAVELPGHGTRLGEPLCPSITRLAAPLAEAIARRTPGAYALFGHSMGALLAYEVARRLQAAERAPVALCVSGSGAPHLREEPPLDSDMPEEELLSTLREMNGTPEAVLAHPELRALFLPILRADLRACADYRCDPSEPLTTPLIALGGLQDPFVSRSDLEAWRKHTTGRFALRMFPGDHFYLQRERALLIEGLCRELGAVQGVQHGR